MRGWKRPLWTGTRVYRTKNDIMKRISWLCRQYGDENIAHMPKKGDPTTEIIYIRLN
jgi:hypothetical protein